MLKEVRATGGRGRGWGLVMTAGTRELSGVGDRLPCFEWCLCGTTHLSKTTELKPSNLYHVLSLIVPQRNELMWRA